MEDDGLSSPEHNPYFAVSRNELNETFSSDRFSRTTKSKSLAGDTVVVEDESGIRLAITEQFPSNNSNLKSILKKGDKKNKSLGESFSQQSEAKEESKFSRNRIPCSSKPNITCEECSPTDSNSFNLSVGFQNGNLAQVTSFIPDAMNGNNSIHYLSIGPPQLLNVGSEISRSKSEPNTRSNSSENLKPLRESSSWNSQSFNVDAKNKEGVICPSCDTIFPPSLQVNFPDHFELCQTENNQF